MANETSFKDKIIKVFNMDQDDAYEDEYYEDDEDVVEERYEEPAAAKRSVRNPVAAGFAGAEVLVVDPEVFNDAPTIVNKIKENKTVVVNLKNTEYEEGGKIFNFLNGAVFALEGSINQIAEQVFILAPRQVSVSTEMEKKDDEYISPILEWDRD